MNPWAGAWRRTLLVAPGGLRDTNTSVTWVQGPSVYVDLRIGTGTVEGFAGTFSVEGARATWEREIDLDPPGDTPDVGDLRFEGDVLIEDGVHMSYVEHWQPLSRPPAAVGSVRAMLPDGGLLLGAWAGDRVGLAWQLAGDHPVIAMAQVRTEPGVCAITAASDPGLSGRDFTLSAEGIPALGLSFAQPIETEGAWVS